jgi:prolyl-tRNA synthetase
VVDDRDNLRPGTKYGEWERRGVPLRLEIGPRDLEQQTVMLKARHDRAKNVAPMAGVVAAVTAELARIQADLYARALARRAAATHVIDTWDDFKALYAGAGGFALSHWCGDAACEKAVQEELAVTIRNIPFARDETPGACVHCGKPSAGRVVFAQSY